MKIEDVEEENFNKLLKDCEIKKLELEELKKETPSGMWSKELDILTIKFKEYVNLRKLRKGEVIKKKLKIKKSKKT